MTAVRWDEVALMREGCRDGSWCVTGEGVIGDKSRADEVNVDGAGRGRCIGDPDNDGVEAGG